MLSPQDAADIRGQFSSVEHEEPPMRITHAQFHRSAQQRNLSIVKKSLLAVAVILCVLLLVIFHRESVSLTVAVAEWAKGTGLLGMLCFATLDAIFISSMLPGFLFTILAGTVWGLWLGFVVALAGKFVGAMASFALGRLLCTPCAGIIRSNARTEEIMHAIARSGWKISLLLRISPLIPYNILNFFFAASDISWFEYTWTSIVGMLPGTFCLVYAGSIAGDISTSVHAQEEWSAWRISVLVGSIIFSAAMLFVVNMIVKWEMEKVLREQDLPSATYNNDSKDNKVRPPHPNTDD